MNSDAIYTTIVQVQMTSSTNAKMDILRQLHGDLPQKVLRYTLDPHKMYYIKNLPYPERAGIRVFNDLTFRLLDVLANRSLSGGAAKQTVNKYLLTLTKKSQRLFKFIIDKSFRAGFGAETINKVFTGLIPVYKVMKCETWDPKRFVPGSLVGMKLDGIRATYRDGSFWTRSGHRIAGVEHLIDKAMEWELKGEWDGELDIPGVEFNKASGIIRAKYDHRKAGIRFTCFDLPLWDGDLRERLDYYYSTLFRKTDRLFRPLGHHPVNTVAAVLEHFKYALDQGQEGIVVKRGDSPYSRKRSWDWMKLKCGETLDCSVFDFEEGKGKFKGMIGKLIVQDRINNMMHTIGVGKMTQHDQKYYFNNFRELENGMVEVAYMEKQPSGDLRHGRFSKFLWDR